MCAECESCEGLKNSLKTTVVASYPLKKGGSMFEIQNEARSSPRRRFDRVKERVLIVDKDTEYANTFVDYFSRYGYVVTAADDLVKAIQLIEQTTFAMVLIDMTALGMDSLQVLRKIRNFSEVPVIILTELEDEIDTILALEAGADDFLKKDLSPRQLLARFRAIIRRSAKHSILSVAQIKVGHLIINLVNRTATESGQVLKLTTIEFDLLANLAQSKGRILTRQQLLSSISDRDYVITDRAVDVHVSSLRRKLHDDSLNPRFIRTVRTIGYLLLDPEDGN